MVTIMPDELVLTKQIADIVELNKEARPTWDDYFMAVTMLIASRSNCGRLHVGCILVSNGEHKNRIVAAGYNGFMAGVPHNSKIRDGHEQATIHAEQNAITDAARRGISISGATAYVSHFPCLQCAKMLAASGITEIKYHFDYNNDHLVIELLGEWNVKVTRL
ncbi:MAG: dCMP deaminase family protein [Puniceicoccales bacterium]|jgi:dCMP deaminase|nr:dCMP deaminase family protein [Puniceicoccales bacterium]